MVTRNGFPQWVEDIGWAVDKWFNSSHVRDRFARNVVEHGASEVKRATRPPTQQRLPGGIGEPARRVLPARALVGRERYWYLTAIHAAVCSDAKRLKAWGKWLARKWAAPTRISRTFACMAFESVIEGVPSLRRADRLRLVDAVNEVADELKRPHPVISPADIAPRPPVRQVNVIRRTTRNVVIVTGAPQSKKPTGSTRSRKTRLTDRDKEILEAYSDCGRNAEAAAKQLGISKQYVSRVVAKSKARYAKSGTSGRSIQAHQSLPTNDAGDAGLSVQAGASDKGVGRRLRVKKRF